MNKDKKLTPELRFPEFVNEGGWEDKELDKITTKISDGIHTTPAYEIGGEYYFINGNNLIDGNICIDEKTKRVSKEEYLKYKKDLNQSSILLSINGTIGNIAVFKNEKVILGKSACYININEKKVDKNFIIYFIQTDGIKSYFNSELTGSTIKNLSLKSIKETIIKIPTNPQEQQKISSCLISLDEVIAAHSEKLEALKDHKKGLMQNLFPQEDEKAPKLRFKEFVKDGEWKPKVFEEFIKERSEFPYDSFPLYSLTIEDGITPKTERYERSFLVNNEENAYKLVCPNDFAYNPMNLRFGAIAKYYGNSNIRLSKYYNIFYCDNSVDSTFCDIYFKSDMLIKYYNNVATGSLIEKRRVHFSDFVKFKFLFPKLNEQQKIASCLSSLDALITAQNDKIEQLKLHKKGLMQGLFPKVNE